MVFEIRPARTEDVEHISSWTTDTFTWGDYVPDRLPMWLSEDSSTVLVATVEGTPKALVHGVMLSSFEGWLEAARVHPDHRREGLGNALNNAGVEWAATKGARVVRLAIEAANQPAITQVLALGYRQTSSWTYAQVATHQRPKPDDERKLAPATGSDVDAAWVFWSSSELNQAGRGLISYGWQWRNATPGDLKSGAMSGQFLQSPDGWLLADQQDAKVLRILWMATTPEDAPRFLEGVVDRACNQDAESVTIKAPSVPWMTEAIRRLGGDPKEVLVFSKPV